MAVGTTSGATPLLQALALTKRYGDFVANEAIDIDVWPGQILALLGENGAVISTLVKAIYGLIQPSSGELRWQGKPVVLAGPAQARSLGIGVVFLFFLLFVFFSVVVFVVLG